MRRMFDQSIDIHCRRIDNRDQGAQTDSNNVHTTDIESRWPVLVVNLLVMLLLMLLLLARQLH